MPRTLLHTATGLLQREQTASLHGGLQGKIVTNGGAAQLFRSSGQPGYTHWMSVDPRHVPARKLERAIHVRFATAPCTVHTNEGLVHARQGDAILTGSSGEQWRVSQEHFAHKYRPIPPTLEGEAGGYVSLPNRILALPMTESFEVILADGVSHLRGSGGDWLVDYGDGSLGIVSQAIFAVTYERLT